MVMPGIIFGAIFGGITTVTEAAVIAVLYSAFVGMAVYKRIKVRDLPKIILASTDQHRHVHAPDRLRHGVLLGHDRGAGAADGGQRSWRVSPPRPGSSCS